MSSQSCSSKKPQVTSRPETAPEKTSTGLRSKDVSPGISKAELDILRQKIADRVAQSPEKAATLLSEWIKKAPAVRKKTG